MTAHSIITMELLKCVLRFPKENQANLDIKIYFSVCQGFKTSLKFNEVEEHSFLKCATETEHIVLCFSVDH